MGSISIRKSIRWLPDDASEPTSTIVVTSPQRRFVDLRIFLPHRGLIEPQHLEWGIGGTSSSSTREENGDSITRGKWVHWIDSRSEDAPSDEGDMFPIDERTTLEKGRMMNPDTGLETDYEEIWLDETPVAIPGVESTLKCVVLKMEQDGDKGMVVLLGRYCQGITRSESGSISVERWVYGDGNEWNVDMKLDGRNKLPCEEVLRMLKAGDEMQTGKAFDWSGRKWEVVEVA